MTNGDMIKAMFPDVEVKEKNNGYEVYFGVGTAIQYFNHQWWNAPYKELEQQPSEEDILKFYYVESLDDYWIGERMETMYYAKWNFELQDFVWTYSKYLPWGEHVVAPNTLWKEYTYPSEPKEIPFKEWIKGFLKKYGRRKKANEKSR